MTTPSKTAALSRIERVEKIAAQMYRIGRKRMRAIDGIIGTPWRKASSIQKAGFRALAEWHLAQMK